MSTFQILVLFFLFAIFQAQPEGRRQAEALRTGANDWIEQHKKLTLLLFLGFMAWSIFG